MKELTIEQKAKLYDEVVNKLKGFMAQGVDPLITRADVQDFFPELKESEDEKIRKAILEHIQFCTESIPDRDKFLAWLDKQGEKKPTIVDIMKNYFATTPKEQQNKDWEELKHLNNFGWKLVEQEPTDNVEPKFKVGDWVVHDMSDGRVSPPTQIVDMTNKSYVFDTEQCFYFSDAEEIFRKWTIQDAKDGDVLAAKSGNRIFLYNGNCDLRHRPCAYCGTYKGFSEILFSKCAIGNYFTDEDVYPATKKQRDLLFQKMKESGYEWDAEKKELKPNNHVQWSDEEELHIKELESLVKKVWATAERENDKDTIREMSDLSFFLKTLNPEKKGEQRPNPYSGTSFEYNGHTWGMCARDGGVEILVDGHVKGRVFTNDNNAKEMFIKALERVEEENAKGYKLTDCDKNSWWEDFKTYTSCTFEQEPVLSEEDENWLIDAINVCELYGYNETAGWLKNRLKFLKERVQTKQEWSEDDERSIRDSIFYLKSAKKYFEKDDDILWDEKWFNLCIEWLESLYKKLRLQSQWKPSDEQMIELRRVISGCSYDIEPLVEIEEHLKKLKDE